MIFVDTNVFMYAVGKPHRHQESAQEFFRASDRGSRKLCTSAEALQEMMHVYLSTNRWRTFEVALALINGHQIEVWPLEREDVELAHKLHERFPTLAARDLCHLASCQRRGVRDVKTFDQDFARVVDTTG